MCSRNQQLNLGYTFMTNCEIQLTFGQSTSQATNRTVLNK